MSAAADSERPWRTTADTRRITGFFADDFDWTAPAEPLTEEAIRDAFRQYREATTPERPSRIIGQKRDIYDLLIDMGCQFDRTDDGPVPVPVQIGTLSMDVVADEDAPSGVVREEFADGTTARAYMRSRRAPEWFVVTDGQIVDVFMAGRAEPECDLCGRPAVSIREPDGAARCTECPLPNVSDQPTGDSDE